MGGEDRPHSAAGGRWGRGTEISEMPLGDQEWDGRGDRVSPGPRLGTESRGTWQGRAGLWTLAERPRSRGEAGKQEWRQRACVNRVARRHLLRDRFVPGREPRSQMASSKVPEGMEWLVGPRGEGSLAARAEPATVGPHWCSVFPESSG